MIIEEDNDIKKKRRIYRKKQLREGVCMYKRKATELLALLLHHFS